MHSALVIVQKPKSLPLTQRDVWQRLCEELKGAVEGKASVEMLGEWCFLVTLADGGLEVLGDILQIARHDSHRVLFFKKKPEWNSSIPAGR